MIGHAAYGRDFTLLCSFYRRDFAKQDRRASKGIAASFYSMLALTLLGLVTVAVGTQLSVSPTSHAHNADLRSWRERAINIMWEERRKMGHTPLRPLGIPGLPHVEVVFKDESQSPTGNLKHRFSWALFMWAIVEGQIKQNTTVYEASSGNTACSEAYMAKRLGIPFIAVIPDTTEDEKVKRIQAFGGKVLKTQAALMFKKAEEEAKRNHGFYMNQFANADKAEEYHASTGNVHESMNVMHEIVNQLKVLHANPPDYFVHTAGTGGTISSVGRYVQKHAQKTKVVMADTQFSIYYDYVINNKFTKESGAALWKKPGMAGTGFGYSGPAIEGVTTSLRPNAIDIAYKIPDLASTAAMHVLRQKGVNGGTSTGVNFVTALSIGATSPKNKKTLIVPLICDKGDLYEQTYYNTKWIETQFKEHGGLPIFNCWKQVITHSIKTGSDPLKDGAIQCRPKVVPSRGRRFVF
uniref:PALP domain-containing protein n=1 Tax=Panagrellus redivivus TaxID=6233 RepID=A0A7E4V8F4_PANRE